MGCAPTAAAHTHRAIWSSPHRPPGQQLGSFSHRRGHFPSSKREESYSECQTSKTKHGHWKRAGNVYGGHHHHAAPGLFSPLPGFFQQGCRPLFTGEPEPRLGASSVAGPRVSVAAVPQAPLLRAPATKVPGDRHAALPGRPGRHRRTLRPPASCPRGW